MSPRRLSILWLVVAGIFALIPVALATDNLGLARLLAFVWFPLFVFGCFRGLLRWVGRQFRGQY